MVSGGGTVNSSVPETEQLHRTAMSQVQAIKEFVAPCADIPRIPLVREQLSNHCLCW